MFVFCFCVLNFDSNKQRSYVVNTHVTLLFAAFFAFVFFVFWFLCVSFSLGIR